MNPYMTLTEVEDFIEREGEFPSTEEMIKAPTKWVPQESNPKKLRLYYFHDDVWHETVYTKFIE